MNWLTEIGTRWFGDAWRIGWSEYYFAGYLGGAIVAIAIAIVSVIVASAKDRS